MLRIKNWNDYKPHKGRRPKWVKIPHGFLMDYAFRGMSKDAQWILPMLMLLATEDKDADSGAFGSNNKLVADRLKIPMDVYNAALVELTAGGFVEDYYAPAPASVIKTQTPEEKAETDKRVAEIIARQNKIMADGGFHNLPPPSKAF